MPPACRLLGVALCASLTLACAADEAPADAAQPGQDAALGDNTDFEAPDGPDNADAGPRVTPSSGSLSGYYDIRLDVGQDGIDADDVLAVRVGDVRAVLLEVVDAETVQVRVQGRDRPGPADVVLETAEGTVTWDAAFSYDPPLSPHFDRVVAVGASLTMGINRGGISIRAAQMSPPAQIARQMGAWVGLPLLQDRTIPQIQIDQVGPPPECRVPNFISDVIETQADAILASLQDPETGAFGYQYVRLDPDLEVRNLGVGGMHVADVVHGPPADDIGINFLGHMVYEPYGEFLSPVTTAPLELVEAMEPTLVLSTDVFGNDIIKGIIGPNIDANRPTDPESLRADLEILVTRLAATGAQVFLANLPRASMLPATQEQTLTMLEDGVPLEEIEARVASIDQAAADANAALDEFSARYDNVHVVDLAVSTAAIEGNGWPAGDVVLGTRRFEGLLGIDGVHFTETGYAMVADAFLIEINRVLQTDVPLIDLETIYQSDPESAEAYLDVGIDVGACAEVQ